MSALETTHALVAEQEQCAIKLQWLRSLALCSVWKEASSEEKQLRCDQERYLTEYVRTLNRLITQANNYQSKE